MEIIGYFTLIIIMFGILFSWIWNNTKDYETTLDRIKYIVLGVIIVSIATLIIFNISKIGIKFENKEVLKKIRQIIIPIFIPINGYITLPHIANLISKISLNTEKDEKIQKKIIILGIIVLISIVLEIVYFHDFLNGVDVYKSIK